MEVAEGEGRREEGSTGGLASSELACGGRKVAEGRGTEGRREGGISRGDGAKSGQESDAESECGRERGRGNGRSATAGESDCGAAGGAGEVRVRGERVK